MFYDIESM